MRAALDSMEDPILHLAVHLTLVGALRAGEIVGLTPEDLDFDAADGIGTFRMQTTKNRKFPPLGNSLLYISLLSVVLIASLQTAQFSTTDLRYAIHGCYQRIKAMAGCVLFRGAPCFCGYFYHHINLHCRCHSNRQSCGNLLKCSAVGYV